jgi:hypothetical protein
MSGYDGCTFISGVDFHTMWPKIFKIHNYWGTHILKGTEDMKTMSCVYKEAKLSLHAKEHKTVADHIRVE